MARILPDNWRHTALTGGARRHVSTLETLATTLGDAYTIYHQVHWTQVEDGQSIFGEIDFIVVSPAGDLLLIEQAPGLLDEGPDGLIRRYPGRQRLISAHMARHVDALRQRLAARPDCAAVRIDYLLYCPDYRVRTPLAAGLAPERIVDHERAPQLAQIIAALLPEEARPAATAQALHRFLRDQINLETDVSALMGQAQALVTRISGGLAHWARQLSFTPFRLHVQATAGAGKTQLALALMEDCVRAGGRALYVCYNRPLADHMAHIAPSGSLACTFHHLCELQLLAHGQSPDFSRPDAFGALVQDALALPPHDNLRFDLVIVDEGQDFPPVWGARALAHGTPDARQLWLEDPMQQLHPQASMDLQGWVTLRARENYRSPRQIVRLLQALLPEGHAPEAASPIDADAITLHPYNDEAGLMQGIKDAVRGCYGAGFHHNDVALLSFRGRDSSRLTGLDRIGPHRLRHFTGRYDLLGQPEYTEGDILLDSVPRFKGQAAPAVILAEVDFARDDEALMRRFFVGATRASLRLDIVLSRSCAQQLYAALPELSPQLTARK